MATESATVKVQLWAQLLKLIPTMIWILCVALLLIYKPNGYKVIVAGFIFGFAFAAVIVIWSVRKARARKLNNG